MSPRIGFLSDTVYRFEYALFAARGARAELQYELFELEHGGANSHELRSLRLHSVIKPILVYVRSFLDLSR